MRILVAEDDPVFLTVACASLRKWGHDPVEARDGEAALKVLLAPDAPHLALLDHMMPGRSGRDVARMARGVADVAGRPLHMVMLTAVSAPADIAAALEAGADDYVVKPFDTAELRARIAVGERLVRAQLELGRRVEELKEALAHVTELQGLLPICSYCRKVRDDQNFWQKVETYLARRTSIRLSHGICPDCMEKIVKPELDAMRRQAEQEPEKT